MPYQIIPVTSFAQNCSLLWCEKSQNAAIVDPGGNPELIIDAVKKKNLNVTHVLLTHGHLDHVGAAAAIAKHFDVKIYGPQIADQFWLEHLPQQSQMFGLEYADALLPNHWLSHQDIVKVGEIELEVRHCPGHTPGHIVFIDHSDKTAWVGDVLFHGGIGRTDFPQGSYEDLLRSIKTELLTLDDDYHFIPGHGPSSTIGDERAHNPFLQG